MPHADENGQQNERGDAKKHSVPPDASQSVHGYKAGTGIAEQKSPHEKDARNSDYTGRAKAEQDKQQGPAERIPGRAP